MNCTTCMSLLEPPLTFVFGFMFIVTSVMATVGNGFSLFIIWRPGLKLTSSTKILTSLVVSDLLVGIILSPLTCFQVLNYISLNDCEIDYARRYLFFFLCNTSGLTLVVISYDRYILLTKLTNYNKFMTKNKLIVLLILAWLVPALIPLLQLKIFGPYVYLFGILTVFFGALVFLIISYSCIVKVIRQKEKQLETHEVNLVESSSDNTSYEKNEDLKESDISRKRQRREKKVCGSRKICFNFDTVLFTLQWPYKYLDYFELTKCKAWFCRSENHPNMLHYCKFHSPVQFMY